MNRYTFTLIFSLSILFAQTNVETYRTMYNTAMADSVITEEEQSLLETLRTSLDISDEDLLLPAQPLPIKETPLLKPKLNQEGRWYIMYQNMALGNGLYGFGIPHVLGIDDPGTVAGLQLLLLAGGFYTSWMYTKEMEIPYGRAYAQHYGGVLGMYSLLPLMALTGFENWYDFDPDGKITSAYLMAAAPLGIYQMDKLYRKWRPSDGQTQMIIGGSGLAGFNTWGLYSLITDIPDDLSDTWLRVGIPLTYAGTLAGGYFTHKYVMDKSYTRGDALFTSLGTALGMFTWMELLVMLEMEGYRENMLLALTTINAYSYFADKMTHEVDLTVGDAGIVGLGTAAGFLTWVGIALITDIDSEGDGARLMDIAAANAGFYFTYKAVSKRHTETSMKEESNIRLSMLPTILSDANRYIPGMNLTLRF